MKLVFVIKTLGLAGGGAERVLAQITSALVKRGHEITLVGFGSADERDFYQVDEKIQRIWLHAGHSNKRSGPIEIWRRALALRRLVRRLNPDVAVGFMHSAYVPLALALAGTRIPVVASEHILFDHYRAFPLEALALRVTAPLYERITVISEAIRASYPNGLASRMEVVPNPVLPADRESGSRERRSNIVLNVGRLFAQKDQRSLIEAFALVAETHAGWTLRIVGEGPLRPMLETLIVQLGLEDRVELPGAVGDISREYQRAEIFAMSSQYESFGLATAEALAHGLPAIGFADCPGTNELIHDGVNGLLVKGDQRVTDFAAALSRLMEDGKLRKKLGRSGPQSIEKFSLKAISSKWEQLLEASSRRKPRGPA